MGLDARYARTQVVHPGFEVDDPALELSIGEPNHRARLLELLADLHAEGVEIATKPGLPLSHRTNVASELLRNDAEVPLDLFD